MSTKPTPTTDVPHAVVTDKDGTNTGPGVKTASKSSVEQRAHVVNRGNIERRLDVQGPGSLDPSEVAPPASADEKRFFAKRGVQVCVPPWMFLGLQHEGRSAAYNHSGTIDGHALEFSFWRMPADVTFDKLRAAYVGEEMDELVRLGRVAAHEIRSVGGVEGVLVVGAGPQSAEAFASADPEELFLVTDGTGRRTVSWRGPVSDQLVIVSMTSPVETAFLAMPVFDAVLSRMRIS